MVCFLGLPRYLCGRGFLGCDLGFLSRCLLWGAEVLALDVLADNGHISGWRRYAHPASIFRLGGGIPTARPTCYILFQMLPGLVQVAIRILMLAGYRRTDAWACSNFPHAFGTHWNRCEHSELPSRLKFLTGIYDACKLGHSV